MPEAFDGVVFSLPEGRASKVVKSPYGFHIFKVLKKEKGRWIELPDVKEKIKADLAKGKEEQEFRKWLDALKSEAKVRIDEQRLKQVRTDETRAEEPTPGQTRPAPGKG
jgi:parvulin-like peptidyl-prolyl isomerase